MKLIKLNAIDSTNEFLKGLSNQEDTQNFTVVSADNQYKGKGQMGALWNSEIGKNLIMSILIKNFLTDVEAVFNLNVVVSLSVIRGLNRMNIPDLSIKWPNDIMSASKKIGGILIENSIKGDGTITSIIGIGLNVNQLQFEDLPRASSLAIICNSSFDKEEVLSIIVEELEFLIAQYESKSTVLWEEYIKELFKMGVPTAFSNDDGIHFMGIIKGVSPFGKLQILLENDTIKEYNLKEVQMLY
jgi:BirA family biotin operon repressor/biotin-[acetyl-CoA-carboxylase] ligase